MKLTKNTLKKLIQETYQSDIARKAHRIDPRLVAKGEPPLESIEPAVVDQLTDGLNKVMQEMKNYLGDEETLAELIDMAEEEIQNFRKFYNMDGVSKAPEPAKNPMDDLPARGAPMRRRSTRSPGRSQF